MFSSSYAMDILESTRLYESWLSRRTHVITADLKRKHQFMLEAPFPFFRGTFYRWLQVWPKVCKKLHDAPTLLAVGDLHVENFGTWRDAEGRLAWGINDFDEAAVLPYALDLVRLAASAITAIGDEQLSLRGRDACDRILEGYRGSLAAGGQPFVLAEQNRFLRDIAQQQLRDPRLFWDRMQSWPTVAKSRVPKEAIVALEKYMPRPLPQYRIVARQAGLGSRGHQRYLALYTLCGGLVSRQAKALVSSALNWLDPKRATTIRYADIMKNAVRAQDPTFRVEDGWLVRRIAPDSVKLRLSDLPAKRNEERLLSAMGWETANVHLGSPKSIPAVLADLKKRKADWLYDNARDMAEAMRKDWKNFRAAVAPQ